MATLLVYSDLLGVQRSCWCTHTMLKKMSLGMCFNDQRKLAFLLSFTHLQLKNKWRAWFAFHHSILSPYGQSFFWHGLTVNYPPPHTHTTLMSHSYSVSQIIICKSRTSYAINIRLLYMVINQITDVKNCAGMGAQRMLLFLITRLLHLKVYDS